MISLKEYKDYLINYYRYEIDNNPEKRNERQIELSHKYNDDMFLKVISDTYDFINDIFASDTIDNDYCSFELEPDDIVYISLNICGGGFPDIIYTDLKGRKISRYILKNTFGDGFIIEEREEETPFLDDGEIGIIGIECDYLLYMQGFPKNMKEIKENLFGKNKQLIKVGNLSA
ncbi:MAG: hypothetical protein IJ565_02140 [Bacilli bacterium]|nr:hypothetical protein [Bacilli bacterium]